MCKKFLIPGSIKYHTGHYHYDRQLTKNTKEFPIGHLVPQIDTIYFKFCYLRCRYPLPILTKGTPISSTYFCKENPNKSDQCLTNLTNFLSNYIIKLHFVIVCKKQHDFTYVYVFTRAIKVNSDLTLYFWAVANEFSFHCCLNEIKITREALH